MLNALLQKISEKKEIRVAVIGAGVLVVLAVVFLVYRSFSTRPAPVAVTQPVVEETMKKETTADTRMFFDQGAVAAKSGETFSVTVMIDPGVNRVSGTDFEVGYDAKKLKLEKITPSDVFPLGLREAKIDNVKGTGSIAIAAPLEKSSVGELADVGVVFSGTENSLSLEAADAVILKRDIGLFQELIHVSRRSYRIARESMLIGIGLSIIGMFVGALGYLPPVQGAILQEVIDALVIVNAVRAAYR